MLQIGMADRTTKLLPPITRRALRWIALFSVFLNVLVLAVPLYMLQIYDRVLVSYSLDTLIMISIVAVLALAGFGWLEGVRGILAGRAAAHFEDEVSPVTFRAAFQGTYGNGDPMQDVATMKSFLSSRPFLSLFDLPSMPIFCAITFIIHPMVGGLTLVGIGLLVILALTNDGLSGPRQSMSQLAMGRAFRRANALLQDRMTVHAMGMTDKGLAAWKSEADEAAAGLDAVNRTSSVFFGMSRFVRMGLQAGVLGLGAYLVLNEEITAGMVFASSIIAARAIAPIEQAVGSWRSVVRARDAYVRLKKFLWTGSTEEVRTELPRPKGRLAFDKVSFQPPGDPAANPIVQDISFELGAGESLAIVGPSGAGKSTVARLMVGAIAPSSGQVMLDNADINIWPDSLRFEHIGYLPQAIDLQPATIAENIARLDPDASDEDIVKAAKWVGVHDTITQLPGGYQTPVGPGGVLLSGGQTQRIGLARAFYGDPRFVVLDEPNAFLDADGERTLAQTVALGKELDVTIVIVTQRTAVLQSVDKIMVVRDGKLTAYGPRQEVIVRLLGKAQQRTEQQAADGADVRPREQGQ